MPRKHVSYHKIVPLHTNAPPSLTPQVTRTCIPPELLQRCNDSPPKRRQPPRKRNPEQDTLASLLHPQFPIEIVGDQAYRPTVATATLSQELTMITIGSTANPFLRAADDLGFGPNHLFAVEPDANLAGIDEWLGISPPSYVATNVPSFIQQLPEAQANHMVADILVAMWTGDKQDLSCTGHPREDPLHKWCNQVQTAIQAASEGLRLRSAIVVVPAIQAKPPAAISDLLNQLPQGWNGTITLLNNTEHGGRAATAHWVAVLGTKEFVSLWTPPPIEHHNTQDMQDVLDSDTANGTATLILSQFDVRPDRNPTPRPSDPKVAVWIRERGEHQWWPVYDPAHPAPVVTGDGDHEFGSASFGFLSHTPLMQPCVREASQTEVLRTLGFDDLDTKAVRHAAAGALDERIPNLPGVQGARAFLLSVQQALAVAPAPTTAPIMVLTGVPRESWPQANRLDANPIAAMGPALNRWTTIPLPTEHSWQEACKADPDIRRIRDHLTGHYLLERDRLNNPAYWEPLQQGRLALDGDTLYHYEQPTHARVTTTPYASRPTITPPAWFSPRAIRRRCRDTQES